MKTVKLLTASTLLALAAQSTQVNAAALADIYQQALLNDPQLKAAHATYLAGAEATPLARAALLPQLNLSANTTWYDTETVDFNNNGYTLSLSQPLFDASSWFSFKRGESLSEQARLQFEQAQQDLIIRTVKSYLDVLRAQSTVETNQAQERAIKRRLDQVNARFEVGMGAITNVQEAQAAYDNARVARIEAEGSMDNSYEALERLTGKAAGKVDLLGEDYPVLGPIPAQAQPWLEKARAGNLSLRSADATLLASRQAAKAARADHLPTVSLNATYDYDKGTASSSEGTDATYIGLTLSLPVFSGGLISSQSRQAAQQMTAAQENREDALRAVTQSTRSLLRNLQTDVQSVSARKQSIKSSETALKATEEGFNEGTRNVVDVLDAEQKLYAAQLNYANARFNYVLNLFNFKQQLGTLSPDDLNGLDQWLTKP
ncbi:MAG: TolC family outer membrane protein [Pontibacterium sp.]